MELTATSSALARELGLASRIISRKPAIPILSNVLVVAKGNHATMTATDYELAMRSTFEVVVAAEGSRALPAQKLHDLMRTIPEADVRLVDDGTAVSMSAVGFRAKLQTLPAEDFPKIDAPEGVGVSIPAAVLADLIPRVRFACSEDDKRYFLMGAYFEILPGIVRMVATDSHRLAIADAATTLQSGPEPTIIPKKTLDALAAVLDGAEGEVVYTASGNHLFFEVGNRTIVSRRVDGKFPEYNRVVPKTFGSRAVLATAPLVDALKRVSLVAESGVGRKVAFALTNGAVVVSAKNSEGEADERVEAEYSGPDVTFACNGGYVLDAVAAAGTATVALECTDGAKPTCWSAVGVPCRCIVMPVVL